MRPASQAGFTLLSVLVAVLLLGFGLLTVGKSYLSLVNGATQNQDISALAELSNEFWGAAQASPAVLDTLAAGPLTYTAANKETAPAALRPWLMHLVAAMPDAQVNLSTGAGCSASAGCAVTVTVSWGQSLGNGSAPVQRQQRFDYQFKIGRASCRERVS
jgi:Tfp pilus assembly protein PilV